MNDEYDELIINKYIKTMLKMCLLYKTKICTCYSSVLNSTYVHVSFQQFVMVGKIKEKELCCVIYLGINRYIFQ